MLEKITRISTDEISTFAAQATERALEARKAVGVELNQNELDQVSGGLITLNPGIIAGGKLLQKLSLNLNTLNTFNAGNLGAGQLNTLNKLV